MGCDGGTIPRRDELVKTKKKPEAKDKDLDLIFKWRHCSITHEVLQDPVVVCGLGKLYNKVALIEALINKEALPEASTHVKSLKDVKDLNLSPNPAFKDSTEDVSTAPYICPVSGLEMSGKFRFVALWSCGCVFSERALKEINVKSCPLCQKAFTDDDVVIVNGTDEDLVLLRDRMELRQKSNKKNKKSKRDVRVKKEIEEVLTNDKEEVKAGEEEVVKKDEEECVKKDKEEVVKKEPEDESSSKGKKIATTNIQDVKVPMKTGSLKRNGAKTETEEAKKMKRNYSVAKDPKVTDVYKSLFTSHKSEQEQNRAHWVTYNPFYN